MKEKIIIIKNSGPRIEVSMEEALKRLGFDPKECYGIGIRVEKDENALETYICGDDEYPGITIDGYDRQNRLYYLSTSELPNDDHKSMTTYLYGGCAEVESDDWLARISHGYRDEKDNTRHIIYIDRKLATTVSTNIEQSDAATEAELNDNK